MQNSLAIALDILTVVYFNTQGETGISGGFDMKGRGILPGAITGGESRRRDVGSHYIALVWAQDPHILPTYSRYTYP